MMRLDLDNQRTGRRRENVKSCSVNIVLKYALNIRARRASGLSEASYGPLQTFQHLAGLSGGHRVVGRPRVDQMDEKRVTGAGIVQFGDFGRESIEGRSPDPAPLVDPGDRI
jgi:hypothetical protein